MEAVGIEFDWHANSLEFDPNGHLILSRRFGHENTFTGAGSRRIGFSLLAKLYTKYNVRVNSLWEACPRIEKTDLALKHMK